MRVWWVLAGVGIAAVAAGAVLHARGTGGFATHPASTLSLAAAGAATAFLAARAPARSRGWLTALAVALSAYVALGIWASLDPNVVAMALWAIAWVPITGLITVVGLAAAGARRVALTVAIVVSALAAAGAVVAQPVDPFVGVATVAPEGWSTRAAGVTDILTIAFMGVLLAAAAFMIVRVVRAQPVERRQTLTCAAVTAGGPGLVVVCVALAVLADPGDVDPSSGSVAYLAAIAGTAVLTSFAVVSFSRWALRALLTSWMLAIVVLAGVLLAPLVAVHATVGILAVIAVVIAAGAVFVVAIRALDSWASAPSLQLIGGVVPGLTPRENEVLALLADGATNAGIAASLFVSERTVEQHLRSIFAKLQLGPSEGSNRRVRAAAIWWQHRERTDGTGAIGLTG